MSLRGKTAVVGVYEHPTRYAPHLKIGRAHV